MDITKITAQVPANASAGAVSDAWITKANRHGFTFSPAGEDAEGHPLAEYDANNVALIVDGTTVTAERRQVVKLYEEGNGRITIGYGLSCWYLSRLPPDMEGAFADNAQALIDEAWSPESVDGASKAPSGHGGIVARYVGARERGRTRGIVIEGPSRPGPVARTYLGRP